MWIYKASLFAGGFKIKIFYVFFGTFDVKKVTPYGIAKEHEVSKTQKASYHIILKIHNNLNFYEKSHEKNKALSMSGMHGSPQEDSYIDDTNSSKWMMPFCQS